MDYIERRAKRLEVDYRHCLRDYKRALSRTWILRERLGRLPLAALDGADGISSLSSNLSAVAERAGWLRRRTSEAQGRLKVFDPDERRRWNTDVDGTCRHLNADGTHCGKPTVDGSRWCAGHVDMWDDCDPWGNHIIGMWREIRFAYTATGMLVRLTAPTPVGLDALRETIARSRGKLERETYGFDRKCTRKDVERWLTVPAEYTRGGVVSLASCPFRGGTVHISCPTVISDAASDTVWPTNGQAHCCRPCGRPTGSTSTRSSDAGASVTASPTGCGRWARTIWPTD